MRSVAIDPVNDLAWRALLDRSPAASIFHHPAWLKLLSQQYGYDFHGCCVSDDAGTIVAGLPIARISSWLTGNRLVSLPFSDICPPLTAEGDQEALAGLRNALEAERQKTGLDIEIRAELPEVRSAFVRHRYYHHLLPLQPDVEAVKRNFSKSQVKRGITKALREGLTAERRTDLEALDTFYGLHLRTRTRQGMPTQPKRFIRRFAELFDEGLGFVLLVRLGDRPVAGAVFLTFKQTITYKYGASDVCYLSKRPNNLLFMEAIRWACQNGFTSLDFGRTELDNIGLRSFKGSWGATESDLAYTYLRDEPPGHETGLRDRLMGTVITHSPIPVSRLVGEGLYRHFG